MAHECCGAATAGGLQQAARAQGWASSRMLHATCATCRRRRRRRRSIAYLVAELVEELSDGACEVLLPYSVLLLDAAVLAAWRAGRGRQDRARSAWAGAAGGCSSRCLPLSPSRRWVGLAAARAVVGRCWRAVLAGSWVAGCGWPTVVAARIPHNPPACVRAWCRVHRRLQQQARCACSALHGRCLSHVLVQCSDAVGRQPLVARPLHHGTARGRLPRMQAVPHHGMCVL